MLSRISKPHAASRFQRHGAAPAPHRSCALATCGSCVSAIADELVARYARTPSETAPDLAAARSMDIVIWLVVGLIAGLLASAVLRSGLSLVGDIVLGIVGAFVGGWVFSELGWRAPLPGLVGVIAVAFIGAVIALGGLHLIRGAPARR